MEQLIEFYAKKAIRPNEGYRFVKAESVYLPILQVHLGVTKRDYFCLPLLDEIVLRLLDEKVLEISELVGILGIDRNLLEVTLADLYVKDMIYCKAEHCSLMAKGRTALHDLSCVERSKECLKNVYLDPINNTVLSEYEHLNFIEKVYDDDKKMDADFDKDNINIFKKNIDSIQKLFEDEMSIYHDTTKIKPSELLSIDEIEKVYPKFVKLSFAIFVSESGYDIDITSVDKNMEKLLAQYKGEIISQIRNHSILKKVFTKYALKKHYGIPNYEDDDALTELSKKYYITPKGSAEKEEIRQAIENSIYSNRELKDTEFDYLFPFMCKNTNEFVINLDCLDDWCYGNDFFTTVLSRIGAKRIKQINYSTVRNLNVCTKNINRTIKITVNQLQQKRNLPYFSVEMDNGWKITICPEDIPILDTNTHIYRYHYILEQNNTPDLSQ